MKVDGDDSGKELFMVELQVGYLFFFAAFLRRIGINCPEIAGYLRWAVFG